MKGIDLGEQQDILTRVTAREGTGRRTTAVFDVSGGAELRDEPGALRARQSSNLGQVAPEQTLLGRAQGGVTETAQGVGDELVGGLSLGSLEL